MIQNKGWIWWFTILGKKCTETSRVPQVLQRSLVFSIRFLQYIKISLGKWFSFLFFYFRKSLWWWRSSTTTRSARTMPLERSSLAAKPQAQRWSTGPTCWPTRAAQSPSGIPSNRRKISTALWLPLMPRSNFSHLNLTNQLTNQPTHHCMTPHTHPYVLCQFVSHNHQQKHWIL